MANYESCSRTNYFKVTDVEKLEKIVDKVGAELWVGDEGTYAFGNDDGSSFDYLDEETGDMETIAKELIEILAPGEVAVVTEIGNEKLRYLGAYAVIMYKKLSGKTGTKYISLDGIVGQRTKRLMGRDFEIRY